MNYELLMNQILAILVRSESLLELLPVPSEEEEQASS